MSIKETRGKIYYADPADLTIEETKGHPLTDEASNATPLNESLVKNIMFIGEVIEPIQCVRDGERIIVANGRSRVRACREANKRLVKQGKEPIKISYTVKRGEKLATGVMISANEFRRDINVTERGEKCQALMNGGRSVEELAELFGVTIQTIGNWLAILDCSAKVRKAVNEGLIKPTAAVKLAKLPAADQDKQLEKLLDSSTGKATARKAEKLSRGERQETIFKRPTKAELEAYVKADDTPNDAKDVLMFVLGKAERPWKVSVSTDKKE